MLVRITCRNKTSQVPMVDMADLGILSSRLIPGKSRVGRVRNTLPRGEAVVGVEAHFPGWYAGGGGAVCCFLAGADVGVVAPGGGDAVVLSAVG